MPGKKKSNKVPTSPSTGPAASSAAAADSTSWLDQLSGEDARWAKAVGCVSLADFKAKKEKFDESSKKAKDAQSKRMWENEKNAAWEKEQAKAGRVKSAEDRKWEQDVKEAKARAKKEGVITCEWDAEGGAWAKLPDGKWAEGKDDYYCSLCDKHLNDGNLPGHLSSDAHKRKVAWNFPNAAQPPTESSSSAARPKAPPKASGYSCCSWGPAPAAPTEEWQEVAQDGFLRCIPCGKVIDENHITTKDHLRRLECWLFDREKKQTGYQAPPEEHLAWVPSDDGDPDSERWVKCLLCKKFSQDDWSHAGCPGDSNPQGSKDHLKKLANWEWYAAEIRAERLRYHPELARKEASPTRSAAAAKAQGKPKAAPQSAATPFSWDTHQAPAPANSAAAASAPPPAPACAAAAAPAPPYAALPAGWSAHFDAEFKDYFYVHDASGVTQWELPTDSQPAGYNLPEAAAADPWGVSKDKLPAGWRELVVAEGEDYAGEVYYYNAETRETSWTLPKK